VNPGPYSAVILAGGAGRRLGGVRKPALPVGGSPMVARVLAAVVHASIRVVVGPPPLRPLLPAGVHLTQEEPPGGGPVAGLAAGLVAVRQAAVAMAPAGDLGTGALGPDEPVWTALLAGDLPLLTSGAIDQLLIRAGSGGFEDSAGPGSHQRRVSGASIVDGAVYVDADGRPQWLCGVWRTEALRRRLSDMGAPTGRSIRELVSDLRVARLSAPAGPPPWYDCDTVTDVQRAEEWIR
jgi:molybdenum cofactor guanylyltransferase